MVTHLIRFCVRNPLITLTVAAILIFLGWLAWEDKTVDAIPDISENQTVVLTEWPGRSPQDVEDQITYPLSTELTTVRGVKEVRGLSGFGFSQIYVVFQDRGRMFSGAATEDFYQARTRVLEKLASLSSGLPPGVQPVLGPDATALGQVFWYTVEGPYDLPTLRSLQDWVIRFALQSVEGVAEVATAGGMRREYQIDVDPQRLKHYGASLMDVQRAVERANRDVGAKTIEHGGMESLVRGLGFFRRLEDIEKVVVGYLGPGGFTPAVAMGMGMGMGRGGRNDEGSSATPLERVDRSRGHTPLHVDDLGTVRLGPAFRRGALADEAGERVGGVVTMRFGENPRDVIERVKRKILELTDPAQAALPDGVRIVPFYDRTQLIDETQETLEIALRQELVITIAVVVLFLLHLRSSLIIAATLPIAVLMSFVLMQLFGVDSNIMSLTGIAIAIGTMVDMGIVMTENVYQHLLDRRAGDSEADVVEQAAVEVGPALLAAVATTVVSFLPIFFLQDEEGKLFRPLAWTKTFALVSAALCGILLVPVVCRFFLRDRPTQEARWRAGVRVVSTLALALACGILAARHAFLGLAPGVAALIGSGGAFLVLWRLTRERLVPIEANPVSRAIRRVYEPTLRAVLAHKGTFLVLPSLVVLAGVVAVLGGRSVTAPLRAVAGDAVGTLRPVRWLEEDVPPIGQEFMPPLDEGSLLYMPSLLPAAGLDETLDVMRRQIARMRELPEVARAVGKLGRAETSLDPAPVAMIETIVVLQPRDLWRPGLTREDLLAELLRVVHTPGASEGRGAWLQPIETRIIMLNAGIRAPMALKLIGAPKAEDGSALDTKAAIAKLEETAYRIREHIAGVEGVAGPNVENLGGKPYVEFVLDDAKLGHLGLNQGDVTDSIATAIGGRTITRTLEGRERYDVRLAYPRELRDSMDALRDVPVRGAGGDLIPIRQVTDLHEVIGPAAIKTEDGQLRLHLTFAASGIDEGTLMERVLEHVEAWRATERRAGRGDPVPAGVRIEPAGRYESQIRARERFLFLIPICIVTIAFLLYLTFRDLATTLLVFSAVPVVVAGGLVLLRVFPAVQDQMFAWGLWDRASSGPIHVTVAVVVGFIALLGIATDDGVVIATYLRQTFQKRRTETIQEIREAVVEAGLRRIRPCLMTTFTTVLALYPILASSGRGSDVARPMALPAVGGMLVSLISLYIVPCCYCWVQETRLRVARALGRDPS